MRLFQTHTPLSKVAPWRGEGTYTDHLAQLSSLSLPFKSGHIRLGWGSTKGERKGEDARYAYEWLWWERSSVMSIAKWDHKWGMESAFLAFSCLLLLINFYFILMAFAIFRLLFFVTVFFFFTFMLKFDPRWEFYELFEFLMASRGRGSGCCGVY